MATFAELVGSPDMERVYLIETNIAKEVQAQTWNATGAGSWWTIHTDGEVNSVEEDGVALTEHANVGAVDAAAGWFYDHSAQRLYVHPTGNDAPDTLDGGVDKYTILAFIWLGFTNMQYSDDEVVYQNQGNTHESYYLPYFDSKRVPSISQAVGDYYVGDIRTQFGTLNFLNDGYWYTVLQNYIWHNKSIVVKIGAKGSTYGQYEVIFTGKIRNPRVTDQYGMLDVKDTRISSFRTIPEARYDIVTYANLEEGSEGLVIPILFGQETNITPVQISSIAYIYKIAGHALESIDAVYKDGVALVGGGVDYTADLPNGEFTLTADPGTAVITCDAKGVKCGYDHAGDAATGLYSYLASDILIYVLNTLNDVAMADIDTGVGSTFEDLQTNRTQNIKLYLNIPTQTMDVIRLLQRSTVFQLIPVLDGSYRAERYQTGTPAGTPYIWNEDYRSFSLSYVTDDTMKKVVIEYARDPSTEEYLRTETSAPKVGYRYDESEILTVRTCLRVAAEAVTLATLYLDMVKAPSKRLSAELPPAILNKYPSNKIVCTKSSIGIDGVERSVLFEEVYRILEMRKRLETSTVGVEAILDIQSTGDYHTNVAHVNSYNDTHTDDAHGNVAHDNVAHDNVAHINVAHDNVAHADAGHGNTHNDTYTDSHANHFDAESHDDSYDDQHANYHNDSAHGNTTHDNAAHGDDAYDDTAHDNTAHTDGEYDDAHADMHANTPHSDFNY